MSSEAHPYTSYQQFEKRALTADQQIELFQQKLEQLEKIARQYQNLNQQGNPVDVVGKLGEVHQNLKLDEQKTKELLLRSQQLESENEQLREKIQKMEYRINHMLKFID